MPTDAVGQDTIAFVGVPLKVKARFQCPFGQAIADPQAFDVVELGKVEASHPGVEGPILTAVNGLAILIAHVLDRLVGCTPGIMQEAIGASIHHLAVDKLDILQGRLVDRRIVQEQENGLNAGISSASDIVQ